MPEQTPVSQQQPEHKKLPIFTTSKNCHTTVLLDGSVFEPTKKTILTPGNFAKNYAKQLHELLYNTEDKISADALLYISQLHDLHEQSNQSFRFVSGIHVRKKQPKRSVRLAKQIRVQLLSAG